MGVNSGNGAVSLTSSPPTPLTGGFQEAGLTLIDPSPGTWTVTVSNLGSPQTGSVQKFTGAIETFHASYSGVPDIAQLSAGDERVVKRALRTGLMAPQSNGFAPGSPATRLDLARALALGGGTLAPQYLPYTADFIDLADDVSVGFVECIT